MRVVALEEHFTVPDTTDYLRSQAIDAQQVLLSRMQERWSAQLEDVGESRLKEMDETGISVQVLSLAGIGADALPAESSLDFARTANDMLAQRIAAHPDRFYGFAHVPADEPEAAADELERCITEFAFRGVMISGTTRGDFLDAPRFRPFLERVEKLNVPLYVHPSLPPKPVMDAYYDGLPGGLGYMLAAGAWGWHSETALHILRLVLSGTLDRFPKLRLIVGHMGEGLPFMLERIDDMFELIADKDLQRSVSETILDQLHITTSGFFSLPPFMAALHSFGADRILFSVDYPFSSNKRGEKFLASLPVSPEDRQKIAHGNADRILNLGGKP